MTGDRGQGSEGLGKPVPLRAVCLRAVSRATCKWLNCYKGMTDMNISVLRQKDVDILSLEGRLDHKGAASLDEQLKRLPNHSRHVILDLQKVDYLSSMGIRSVLSWEKLLRHKDGGMLLCNISPGVSRVLSISGLLPHLHVFENTSQALDFVESQPVQADSDTFSCGELNVQIFQYPDQKSILEYWSIQDMDHARFLPVNLDELGISFGVAGLGLTSQDASKAAGAFISTGRSAAVAPADAEYHPDLIISSEPDESLVFIRKALGFSGSPAIMARVSSPALFSLQQALDLILSHLEEKMSRTVSLAGFIASGQGRNIQGRYYRNMSEIQEDSPEGVCSWETAGFFAAGLVKTQNHDDFSEKHHQILSRFIHSPASGNISISAGALVLDYPDIPGLERPEDINRLISFDHPASSCIIDPGSLCSSLTIWVYQPEDIRAGQDKRLVIQHRGTAALDQGSEIIARRIYQDSARIIVEPLSGGFSADTYLVHSHDPQGRKMLPTVMKIGSIDWIQREIAAYEKYVKTFILNNGATLLGSSSHGSKAGLRYNFLGITGTESSLKMLQDIYADLPAENICNILSKVFTSVLKPWYGQPRWESFLPYQEHNPLRIFRNIFEDASAALGISADDETIYSPELGRTLPNPYHFLKYGFEQRKLNSMHWYKSVIHGDLNLANILLDEKENIYIIDFSETRQGNIVSDLGRIESLIRLRMPELENDNDLLELLEFEYHLSRTAIIDEIPEFVYSGSDPFIGKAYSIIVFLRSLAGKITIFETSPIPYLLSILEWTLPMASYKDITTLRKKASAYSSAFMVERILEIENQTGTDQKQSLSQGKI